MGFERDVSNPVFHPKGAWASGRAIDADVFQAGERLMMCFATRDPEMKVQMAESRDGITWKRVSDKPLLPNGNAGDWNSSESGHPGVFVDKGGATHLFFQGNNDRGRTWWLARVPLAWRDDRPQLGGSLQSMPGKH